MLDRCSLSLSNLPLKVSLYCSTTTSEPVDCFLNHQTIQRIPIAKHFARSIILPYPYPLIYLPLRLKLQTSHNTNPLDISISIHRSRSLCHSTNHLSLRCQSRPEKVRHPHLQASTRTNLVTKIAQTAIEATNFFVYYP